MKHPLFLEYRSLGRALMEEREAQPLTIVDRSVVPRSSPSSFFSYEFIDTS